MKFIDTTEFEKEITASQLPNIKSFNNVDDALSKYNKVLSQILDKHTPITIKVVTIYPEAPWYNQEINVAKNERRKAENTWRKLMVHRQIFVEKKQEVNNLLKSAKTVPL